MDGISKISKFQMGLIGVFGALIIIGFIVLAIGNFGGGGRATELLVWGTVPSESFDSMQKTVGLDSPDSQFKVTYVEKDETSYDRELIEALASGSGPDIFFLPNENILKYRNKVYPIPFEAFSVREYKDIFIDEAELFVFNEGIYAVPFTIDPMVMYWNKILFSNAGITRPPVYWDELFDLVPILTIKDADLNISQSAFALGEHRNITNASEIISALLLQNGVPISIKNAKGGQVSYFEKKSESSSSAIAVNVLNFYTQFSNSTNSFYTWNRSLPESQDYFAQTDLAIYLGFASELPVIMEKNPNLVFDIADFPQTRGGTENVTYGRMNGLAIANASGKKQKAYEAIRIMTSKQAVQDISDSLGLPPVRVDAFVSTPSNPYMPIFQEMALWSRSWLMPSPDVFDSSFGGLITDITSGRRSISKSIKFASDVLDNAYGN